LDVKKHLKGNLFYAITYNFPTLARYVKIKQADIMKPLLIFVFFLFLSTFQLTAQDSIQVQKNTLKDQMTEVFDKSNSYQEYKVIKKTQLSTLRNNIMDSVSVLDKKISAQQSSLEQQKTQIDSLSKTLADTQQKLTESKEKEDGIKILGTQTSKATYNSIMWGIIVLLLLIGGFLFYRFLNSHKITNAAQLKIAELEIELEDHRRKSLESDQKLRRKLQDEINKNRKV